jgi:superfamily II DNA/RNA helicase
MIKTIRKKNPSVQLLLFSATFNDRVKDFALKIAPGANQVFIPKEELSLDVIKQYNVKCAAPLARPGAVLLAAACCGLLWAPKGRGAGSSSLACCCSASLRNRRDSPPHPHHPPPASPTHRTHPTHPASLDRRCPGRADKTKVLQDMIFPNCDKLGQTIIFVRTKDAARQLHATMEAAGYKCTSIQGDMLPEQRDRVVQEFRAGTTKVLISTDVLSRGFDVSQASAARLGQGVCLWGAGGWVGGCACVGVWVCGCVH